MSEETNTEIVKSFPQKRLDQMLAFHREFDHRQWENWRADAAWDWTSHFDAGAEAIYLARQLELIRAGIYEIRYPALKAESLIPFDFNYSEGMQDLTVESSDFAGQSVVARDAPDDIPTVELTNVTGTMTMYNAYLGYSYTYQDAQNALFANKPLQTRKAEAVRKTLAIDLDKIAFLGHAVSPNVRGLLNQTGTTTYATPADGAAGSKKFSDKDAYKVLRDLNGICDAVLTGTNEVEIADTLLLPLKIHADISPRIVGDGTSTTILKAFAENREDKVRIERLQRLESNTGWTGMRAVAYVNNPTNIQMIVPVKFRQQAPQVNGYRVKVNCHMRTGGVAAWLPKSICYGDEIG